MGSDRRRGAIVGVTHDIQVLDGVPGRGKGIQCLRRRQKRKLEVTDILRGVFIGRNSSTHPAQRYKIGVNMLSNRNPQMNNHLSGLPRIDFFAQPLSQREEKWKIGIQVWKESVRGAVESTNNIYRKMGTTYIHKYIPEKSFCNDYVTMKGVVDSFQFIGFNPV